MAIMGFGGVFIRVKGKDIEVDSVEGQAYLKKQRQKHNSISPKKKKNQK